MTEGKAQDLVNGAALVVSAIYFYRKLIEPAVGAGGGGASSAKATTAGDVQVSFYEPSTIPGAAAQLMGQGNVASTGRFVVGWGFTFLTLSLMAPLLPELAGSFAALVALGSILGNGTQVASDVEIQLKKAPGVVQNTATTTPTTTIAYAGQGGAPVPATAVMPQRAAKPRAKPKHLKYRVESV